MKIVVFGGSSFIGHYFVNMFLKKKYDVKYSYFNNEPPYEEGYRIDTRNKEQICEFFNKYKIDLVILSTALTNVDQCETTPDLAETINVKGTSNIMNACKNSDCKIIYISTSAVFDGSKSIFYETDKPKPTSVYGSTKLKGEKIVMDSNKPYLILRTDQPYGWKEKWQHTNSVIRVIDNLKNNKSFNEISNWFNTPTYVPDFVNATELLIRNELKGIFHLVGPDFISRYDWSQKVAEVFHLKKDLIKKINSSELKLAVTRKNICLSNQKLKEKTGHNMIGIEEGLRNMYTCSL